jgi:hypothetical protein
MASVPLDLIIFSGVVTFGIVFLLWVFFHLTIESRKARTRRRHTLSRLSAVLGGGGSGSNGKKIASILILTVICGTEQAQATSPPATDS